MKLTTTNPILEKKLCLFAALLLAAAPACLAQTVLVQYNFNNTNAPLAASTVASGITASSINPVGGFGVWWYAGEFGAETAGLTDLELHGDASVLSLSQAVSVGQYVTFTLSSATPMSLSSLTLDGAIGMFQPGGGYGIASSVDGLATIISSAAFTTYNPTFTTYTVDLSAARFQGLTSISFWIYGYNTGSSGVSVLDNFTVNGSFGVPVSAANTTISANPGAITANGTSTSTITVQAKDSNGVNITSSRGTVTLSTALGSLGTVVDNANGTYTATLTSATAAGTASITGTIAGTAIGHPASVAFTPGPLSAGTTVISANPASITANGTSTSTLTVQARDAHSNNLTSSGGAVLLNTTAGSLGSVTDNGNGTYTAILTSATTTGTASITGTIAGTTIGYPTTVVFTGALSPANTTISANPAAITADGISTSTITVQAKDANGVNLTVSSGLVTLSTTAGSLGSVTDIGNGTYTAILTSSTTPGTVSITGTIAGAAIGNPAAVTFTALVSAANSIIAANPTSIVANGTSTSTITVEAMDANNNVTLTVATVTLNTSSGSLSGMTNNGNGTYTAILTSSTFPGTATITGTIAGGSIGHTTAVVFTQSPSTLVITNIIESVPTGARIAWDAYPGQSYSVLSSPDLVTWTSNSVGVAGQYIDPHGQTAPEMFYQVKENINPNQRISVGKPTAGYTSNLFQNTSVIDDGLFGTFATSWNGGYPTPAAPMWLAENIGQGPTRVLLAWDAGEVGDYAIYTSSNSTTGGDGSWTQVASVTSNTYGMRSHSFDFTGMKWVKMVVTVPSTYAPGGGVNFDEIEVFDISEAYSRGRIAEDAWFFMGDSITAMWAVRDDGTGANDPSSHGPSFQEWINTYSTNYFPSMVNGGIGGESSYGALARLARTLADYPDYHYWALNYGANDSASDGGVGFGSNMQAMITMLKANGRMPVIPHIAYSPLSGRDFTYTNLNAVIDQLVVSNNILAGPDCYTYFKANTNQLVDGLHPTAEGCRSYNLLWANAMRHLYP